MMHFLRTNSPVAFFVLLLIMALVLAPVRRLNAADHGDAPLTAHDIGADLNDVYMFLDPNDNSRLILIMTVHGFIVPAENANFGIFDPAIRYRFEFDTTGDARPDGDIDVRVSPRVAVGGVPQCRTRVYYTSRTGEAAGAVRWTNVDRMGNPPVNVVRVPINQKSMTSAGWDVDDANRRFWPGILDPLQKFYHRDATSLGVFENL